MRMRSLRAVCALSVFDCHVDQRTLRIVKCKEIIGYLQTFLYLFSTFYLKMVNLLAGLAGTNNKNRGISASSLFYEWLNVLISN